MVTSLARVAPHGPRLLQYPISMQPLQISKMVPESASPSSPPPKGEEADVAQQLLKELGYSLDHPLLPAILAHVTRKPAWQQKEELEQFLAHHAVMRSDHDEEKRQRLSEKALQKLRDDESIQRALTLASYTGCNLVYAAPNSSSSHTSDASPEN